MKIKTIRSNGAIKQKLKFKDHKFCLEATQVEKHISKLKQNLMWLVLHQSHREFIKNNKLILKLQQRFTSKKHNVYTEEVNKILLSATDDKKYNQSI